MGMSLPTVAIRNECIVAAGCKISLLPLSQQLGDNDYKLGQFAFHDYANITPTMRETDIIART
jgi:hypothetical protein